MYDIKKESKGLISHGVTTCAGCGLELAIRKVLEIMGKDTIMVVPPGCAASFCGTGIESCVKIPVYQGNLENTAATCSGIRAGLDMQENYHTQVLGFAGDGATVDIGIQALSGAMERNERFVYVCYDNEAYMNTGIQSSSSTPAHAWTTTTPDGKNVERKNLFGIAMAHNVPYAATASIANPDDLQRKVAKAKEANGMALIHVHAPCPTGWGYDPAKSIEIARMAIKTRAWVLCEYEQGVFRLDKGQQKSAHPVGEYLRLQKRFAGITEEICEGIQNIIDNNYKKLEEMMR